MAGPFYNAIKGTTSGTPGTGAFTPNAASSGFLAWSTVATGWIGLVRFEDGTDWELCYSYWNGTTLSRASTQRVASSTGSALSLTSAATAAMVVDANWISPHFASPFRYAFPQVNTTNFSTAGWAAPTVTGTGAAQALATTNFLTERTRVQSTSATTANAQAGVAQSVAVTVASSTAGRGGWEFRSQFGGSQLVTGQRMFVGLTSTTMVGQTVDPSAVTANYAALGKDAADTNFQLLVNSNASTGTKTDTGIPFVANGWYDVTLWSLSGSLTVYMLLIRWDTGDIYYGSTATDTPTTGALMFPQCIGGLSSTTGTAFVLQFGSYTVRSGF